LSKQKRDPVKGKTGNSAKHEVGKKGGEEQKTSKTRFVGGKSGKDPGSKRKKRWRGYISPRGGDQRRKTGGVNRGKTGAKKQCRKAKS